MWPFSLITFPSAVWISNCHSFHPWQWCAATYLWGVWLVGGEKHSLTLWGGSQGLKFSYLLWLAPLCTFKVLATKKKMLDYISNYGSMHPLTCTPLSLFLPTTLPLPPLPLLSSFPPPHLSLLTSMPYAQSHYHLRTRRCLKQPSLLTSSQRALTKREDGENIMSFVAFGTICWCFCVHVCITTTYSHCRQCKFYDHKVQWPNVFILSAW